MSTALAAISEPAEPSARRELGPLFLIEGAAEPIKQFAGDLADKIGGRFHVCPDPTDGDPTHNAALYFNPMAVALQDHRPAVVCNPWIGHDPDTLGSGRRRMLERAALALGVVVVRPLNGDFVRDPQGTLPTVWSAHLNAERFIGNPLEVSHRLPNMGPGSGAWHPGQSILIVGDSPNSAKHGELKHRLPFFSKHAGGYSLWLAEQLEQAGVPEKALYWINAYDCTGQPTSAEFVDRLRPRMVIALGARAATWCREHAWLESHEFAMVPHPQHWRRFRAYERYPLLDVLQDTRAHV